MSQNYTLKTVDSEGNTINESHLLLSEGTVLIQHLPKGITDEYANRLHKNMARSLEDASGLKLITLYPDTSLQVLEIK